ncbi:type IX secretion system membrane protein PorP/SprF [Parasediminibacterium sp. JCM 36343]|uniref:PorP/SprF family type IX secretion system membrane protein n=1 Tax=Parasediminibacterium sp. JCM 36343 TaxID=3374279 RepID=UPI003979A851
MKKIVLSFSLFACLGFAKAQQRPYYTQYILNNYLINPAVAGIDNYTDIKASHRVQWVGLTDAPVTTYLTISAPTKKKLYDIDRETPTSVYPSGTNNMLGGTPYQPPDSHGGVGFTILNDKTGPLNRFAAYGTYAYHLNLTSTTNLALGVSAGITQMSLDASKLNFDGSANGTGGGSDPAVGTSTGILNKINPDISAGLWLYSKNYFIGLAAQQIVPDKLYFTDYSNSSDSVKTVGKFVPHIFAQAGYKFELDEDLTLLPSVLVRYISPLPVGFDINTKLEYQNKIWVGGGYRYQDGFTAMLGLNINYSINIGYSYDYTTSALNAISRGTHEILVGFLIGNKYDDYAPRHAW